MMRWMGILLLLACLAPGPALADHIHIHDPGHLKSVDSKLKVKVGDPAPDFDLPAIDGKRVRLKDYRGSILVISFVPAAWTPICSDQWPGYNLALDLFAAKGAHLVGITVDNLPTQHTWVEEMGGLGFPVLSDFWPHGATAARYGVLRGDGMAERSLFVIDGKGIIRSIEVHDINTRPDLGALMRAIDGIAK